MSRQFAYILSAVLLVFLVVGFAAQDAYAKRPPAAQPKNQISASQAANRARAQHGGKVLKVTRKNQGYRVKLLLDSGRVITVSIRG